ncbi:osmoprotectant ABC transporter ATP-binding subunit YehX [Klebsiella pneumoniae]|uniref:Osmoprotectant ABC transporter ATP-binding subunit YehX n=1 Tax=Klebsiella pneumoniae TaxID=573 RepID=A0A2X3ES18_KLEPN|nr:osmoprotectant ABC transporter ATP-binding subunit YehX [Klebsiella pneumoniae]
MDEPFGALDPVTREALQQEMLRIHRLLGRTIVLVTHDIDEALRLADHLVLMDGGEVVQQGAPLEMLLRRKIALYRPFLAAASWVCACCRCARWGTICVPTNGWRARG